jgi:hypothetical protein
MVACPGRATDFINQTGAGMLGATDSTAIIGQPVTGFLHANEPGK